MLKLQKIDAIWDALNSRNSDLCSFYTSDGDVNYGYDEIAANNQVHFADEDCFDLHLHSIGAIEMAEAGAQT